MRLAVIPDAEVHYTGESSLLTNVDFLVSQNRSTLQQLARWALLLLVMGVVFVLGFQFLNETISISALARHETSLRSWVAKNPLWAWSVVFTGYLLLSVLPGGQVKTFLCGWLFGWLPAVILVSFASTIGACITLVLSRRLTSLVAMQSRSKRVRQLQASIERNGGTYLFLLRLIPGVPFSPVNWSLGPTRLRLPSCWWATQLGMLPQVIVICWAGAETPSLATVEEQGLTSLIRWEFLAALLSVALLPLIVRWTLRRFRMVPVTR